MSHALATVLHRGRKAASTVMSACLASSRGSASPGHNHGLAPQGRVGGIPNSEF